MVHPMKGFFRISLKDLLWKLKEKPEIMSEKQLLRIISSFSCPYNNDVEDFLRNKAITFEKQGIGATHLIFASYKGELVLVGYFTLASKYFHIDVGTKQLGSNLKRRIRKFGAYESDIKKQIIPAPLIGQIGKNFQDGYNALISGDELLAMACNTIREAQALLGGRIVYLECEDTPALISFYERNGFQIFGKRELEEKESRIFKGEYLVQLLRYLDQESVPL